MIFSIKRELKVKIGFICSKGAMLWASKKENVTLSFKAEIEYEDEKQVYVVNVRQNTEMKVVDFLQDESNLTKLIQMYNVNTKNQLREIGFKELDKGKYYLDNEFGQDEIKFAEISIWRGYQVNITSIGNKFYCKVDVCSRVLRIENFFATLKNTGKMKDKKFINNAFEGQSVITRYGSHRIFRIEAVCFDLTP